MGNGFFVFSIWLEVVSCSNSFCEGLNDFLDLFFDFRNKLIKVCVCYKFGRWVRV